MERHNEAAVDAILQGMAWLGTPHDGEIVRQRERIGPTLPILCCKPCLKQCTQGQDVASLFVGCGRSRRFLSDLSLRNQDLGFDRFG